MKNYDKEFGIVQFKNTNYFELFAYLDTAVNVAQRLVYLVIEDSPGLTTLPPLPNWVPNLVIRGCPDLKRITQLPASMRMLSIDNCPQLTHIEGRKIDIRALVVRDCRQFGIRPDQYLACRFIKTAG